MSRFTFFQIDKSLARRLCDVDGDWLEEQIKPAYNDWESRKGELAPYDSQEELKQDPILPEAEHKQLLINWRRKVGGPRRLY